MSDMEAFKSTWSENMPTSPDTPATPGGDFNMFGTAVRMFHGVLCFYDFMSGLDSLKQNMR